MLSVCPRLASSGFSLDTLSVPPLDFIKVLIDQGPLRKCFQGLAHMYNNVSEHDPQQDREAHDLLHRVF